MRYSAAEIVLNAEQNSFAVLARRRCAEVFGPEVVRKQRILEIGTSDGKKHYVGCRFEDPTEVFASDSGGGSQQFLRLTLNGSYAALILGVREFERVQVRVVEDHELDTAQEV